MLSADANAITVGLNPSWGITTKNPRKNLTRKKKPNWLTESYFEIKIPNSNIKTQGNFASKLLKGEYLSEDKSRETNFPFRNPCVPYG